MGSSMKPPIAPSDHRQSVLSAQVDPLLDEDILKIDRLQLINASARY